MYTGLKHLHSVLAYILLAVLIFTLLYILVSYFQKKPFTENMRKISLVGLIAAHLQLLAGLLLYFISPLGMANFSGETMGDSVSRLYMLEHPVMMLIGIILITIGYSKAKRLEDSVQRYKKILLFYGVGLVLILIRIPWMAWP